MKINPNGTQISSTTISNSMNSDRTQKYAGLVHRTLYKRIRDDMTSLTNYIYAVTPQFYFIHNFITAIRILQLLGPAIFASNSLWDVDPTLDMTVSVISVFYHIIPPDLHDRSELFFQIFYILICISQIAILFFSSYYFKKHAKVPNIASYTIVLFYASLNFILHPIALHFAFTMLSKVFFKTNTVMNQALYFFVPFIVIALFALFLWSYIVIISKTLVFRASSCLTPLMLPQNILYIMTMAINSIMGFVAHCPANLQMVLLLIAALCYIATVFIPFYEGGFVDTIISSLISAAGIFGASMCLIFFFSLVEHFDMSFIVLIVFGALFILLAIIFRIIFNRRSISYLHLLDEYCESQDFELIKNPNHFLNVTIDGMKTAHPIVINGTLFKAAIEKWPKCSRIWFLFAKFVAIYPEDTMTLAWIFHSVFTSKLRGSLARTIKEQSVSITRQRESHLSPGLKTKLNNIQKHTQATKHKFRHVWDLVIQGNIGEMEQAVKRVMAEMDKNDADFKHLFRQFPNNRFVTRGYARFCKELMADNALYMEYMEKSKMLQRGLSVNEDLTHQLGIVTFPNLPTRLVEKAEQMRALVLEATDNFVDDDDDPQEETTISSLRQTIENISIPAIKLTMIIRVSMLLVFYILVMIAMFIVSSAYIDNLLAPLPYMESITRVRTKNFHIVTTLTHYIYEELGTYRRIQAQKIPPTSFGSSYESDKQLEYIVTMTTSYIQAMQDFNNFKSTDPNIIKAKSLIFGNTLNYTYFSSLTKHEDINQTIQTGMMDMVTQAQSCLEIKNITEEIINNTIILNPTNNAEQIGQVINEVMDLFIQYISNNNVKIRTVTQIAMICLIIFYIFSFIGAMIYQVKIIQKNKEEAYRALTSIPKNAVSLLVENLRVLKNDGENDTSTNNDTETNKQEENIIKVFMTGDESSSKIGDRVMIIIGSLVTTIIGIVSTVLFCSLLTYESKRLLMASPHLNYLTGSYCQYLSAQYILQLLALRYTDHKHKIHMFTIEEMETRFENRMKGGRDYYHSGRFGGTTVDESPFLGYQEGLDHAFTFTDCDDPIKRPADFMEMIKCYNVEGLYILVEASLRRLMNKHENGHELLHNNIMFNDIWSIYISPIYDGLIFPMSASIIGTIEEELDKKKNQDFPLLIVLLVASILFEALVFIQIRNIDHHIRFTVSLLLHFPTTVVLSTHKASQVLSGDFSSTKNDNTKRKAEFFDQLFKNLPDAVVIADSNTFAIELINKSCERILFSTELELIGKNLKEFFLDTKKFSGEVTRLFHLSSETKIENLRETDPDGSIIIIEVSSSVINNKLVLGIRDMTNIVRYNKLIFDERAKSDTLIKSILPPSLVKRVQAGEKNISFAVQSATILFLDIVSFTPWCGSNEATKVMATLNLMFKKLDNSCSQYPTMTKVKCIGDCYMAAGGIFAEVNQPAEHAREVVCFGLDALENIKELNQEMEEQLQIRVGINTGGPIVAGVLGIGKPTFEILGPAINMAQQMEHNGVPMKVHISRPVYELIYGDIFKIQERGTIECKNGNVVTYLVNGKK